MTRKQRRAKKATKSSKRTEVSTQPDEEADTATEVVPAAALQEVESSLKAPEVAVQDPETSAPKPITATATGARYSVLAGRPSKQGVVAVFGNTGYSLSWVARAERLGITPEELCEKFKADPDGVKAQWGAVNAKKEQAVTA